MRIVRHPNVVELKAFYYSNGDRVRDLDNKLGVQTALDSRYREVLPLSLALRFGWIGAGFQVLHIPSGIHSSDFLQSLWRLERWIRNGDEKSRYAQKGNGCREQRIREKI